MADPRKVVVDASVLVSAAFGGLPAQALDRAEARTLLVSLPIEAELFGPEDDMYLETSQVGRAHFLITRDRDLLSVNPLLLKKHRLGRLEIVTPAQFIQRVQTSKTR